MFSAIFKNMKRYPVPDEIKAFAKVFAENGYSLYIVGGAVRDHFLGTANSDYDFCTDAQPQQVVEMFRKVIPTGIKHGTVTVLLRGASYEVTTFRSESDYSDGRHPDNVTYITNLHEDLSRRDFTINALAADCIQGNVTDDFDGLGDLGKGLVRAIGNPRERFKEDALRLMRLARFCSKLDFKPEAETFQAAKELAPTIANVSQERICDELSKILMTKVPSVGLSILENTGILAIVLPELTACRAIKQNKVGACDVLEHTYNCVDAAAANGYSLTVRLAALLHDIGKPSTMAFNQYGIMRFHGHDVQGAKMAKDVLRRLKCSNRTIDDVGLVIAEHMTHYTPNWTDGAVKRFIRRVGRQNLDMLFELQRCDQIASTGAPNTDEYEAFMKRITELENQPMNLKDLAVTGEDLARAGIPKSKTMGEVLGKLLEMVVDYPTLNDKETLTKQALVIYNQMTAV